MTHLCSCSFRPRAGPRRLSPSRTEAPPSALASWRSRTGRRAPSKMTRYTTAPPRWDTWKCILWAVVRGWRNHLVGKKDAELRIPKVNGDDECHLWPRPRPQSRKTSVPCVFPALGQCFDCPDAHIFQPPGWLEIYKVSTLTNTSFASQVDWGAIAHRSTSPLRFTLRHPCIRPLSLLKFWRLSSLRSQGKGGFEQLNEPWGEKIPTYFMGTTRGESQLPSILRNVRNPKWRLPDIFILMSVCAKMDSGKR